MSQFLITTSVFVAAVWGITYCFMQATTPEPGSNFPKESPYAHYSSDKYEQNLIRGLRKQVREKIEKEKESQD